MDIASADATIRSEELEPVGQYLIGRWFAKVEQARLSGDACAFEEAYGNFWMGLDGLQRVSVACPEAVHFGLALSNHIVQVAGAIRRDLGINPMTHRDWKV
jgi:hypothetical protein